jgi:polyferredoxin
MKFKHFIPFLIGLSVGLLLRFLIGWWGFLLIFPWIGGWITIGSLIAIKRKGKAKDLGRRISILMISPVFLIFLGVMQRENLQIEETVFYTLFLITSGIFTRVLIHFAVAKIIGPFIWGRGFCGWACWTAAFLEWLPIKENKPVPEKYTHFRFLVFFISILIPVMFVLLGYDWYSNHIYEDGKLVQMGKPGALIWFLAGNGIYYLVAILLAFKFKKKRAFCKIACPVSLVMKAQTTIAFVKKTPSGKECISCKVCNINCPMDVDVMTYISAGKKVSSSECILCGKCRNVCSQKAIR